MESNAKVVIIGGGVVGCSILFHLSKFGLKDCILIERNELTSGSSWHAAGGFHTLNGDPNVAKLQAYTVSLYKELEVLIMFLLTKWDCQLSSSCKRELEELGDTQILIFLTLSP